MSRGLGSAPRNYRQHLAEYLGVPDAVPSLVGNRTTTAVAALAGGQVGSVARMYQWLANLLKPIDKP